MKVVRKDEFKFKGVWFRCGDEIPKEAEVEYKKHLEQRKKALEAAQTKAEIKAKRQADIAKKKQQN